MSVTVESLKIKRRMSVAGHPFSEVLIIYREGNQRRHASSRLSYPIADTHYSRDQQTKLFLQRYSRND